MHSDSYTTYSKNNNIERVRSLADSSPNFTASRAAVKAYDGAVRYSTQEPFITVGIYTRGSNTYINIEESKLTSFVQHLAKDPTVIGFRVGKCES